MLRTISVQMLFLTVATALLTGGLCIATVILRHQDTTEPATQPSAAPGV
jgi:hypothetical protein